MQQISARQFYFFYRLPISAGVTLSNIYKKCLKFEIAFNQMVIEFLNFDAYFGYLSMTYKNTCQHIVESFM